MSEVRRFRPVAVAIVMWMSTAVLVVMMVVGGNAIPEDYRFSVLQALTLWGFIGVIALLAFAVTWSNVRADAEGLTVVNGFRRHRFAWSQIAAISMRDGAPWPTLVTQEDRRVILFAIQGSDGDSAREAVRWLQEQIA